MASSSARDIIRNIFGRIDDLSAAINQQQGSSLRRDTDIPPASLEDEVRNVFNNNQVRSSNSAVPRTPAQSGSSMPATNTSAPLYTMRRNFSNFRSANYRSSRGGRTQPAKPSGVFSRDVILVTGPEDEDVPRQGNRVFLQENGHVIMAFPFMKEWSDIEVELKIKEAFQDTIPPLVDFELLQSVHTKLLKPTLAQGQYLTGAMIHRIFQNKPVYVRPTQQILKPPKTREKYEDFDGQDYIDVVDTIGTWPITSLTGATGNNVSSASQSVPTGATVENVLSASQSAPAGATRENVSSASQSAPTGATGNNVSSASQSVPTGATGNNVSSASQSVPTGATVENVLSASQSAPTGATRENVLSASQSVPTRATGENVSVSQSAPTRYIDVNANNPSEQQRPLSTSYDNYLSVLYDDGDDDDDDSDPLAAITASLEDQSRSTVQPRPSIEKQVDEVLRKFINDNLQPAVEEYRNVLVNRKNVLSSTIRAIERNAFSFVRPVYVYFSGEEAMDAGGPGREFFRLLMSSLKSLGIFQRNWFSHDLHLLRSKKYELGGKLISWSIVQGGPGPKCLSEEGFAVMSDLPLNSADAIAAVHDEELKKLRNSL